MEELGSNALWMSGFFVFGYFLITIEHFTKISKTAIALLLGIGCWLIQFIAYPHLVGENIFLLSEHMSNISQVVFFLLGALTIVEIINAHHGFNVIADCIQVKSKKRLLWVLGAMSFFLSSILDNLTTTIIFVTLIRKMVYDPQDRLIFGGAVVIAANAGGAWTPIGDVTTTMLWIGGQLSTPVILRNLFLPSLACCLVSLFLLSRNLKGKIDIKGNWETIKNIEPMGKFIFFLGVGCLLFVPFFKVLTGMPPFMGMLCGLGVMWLATDLIHCKYDDREHLRVHKIMAKVDLSSTLFFFAILLSVDALHSSGILDAFANRMDLFFQNMNLIAIAIGLSSSLVDNVPIVAAAMGMYELTQFPVDSQFWQMIAYCAGTGGSILVIGSAAGIAFMGLEKVPFFWYLRIIGIPAFIGYFAGIGVFFLLSNMFFT